MYGNYDGLNSANQYKPLKFDLHIDVNYWRTVSITDASVNYNYESIVMPFSDSVSVCLINTNNGTPFISTLELRPLKSSMYGYANTTQYLNIVVRGNVGETTANVIRYPDDPYDRNWVTYVNPLKWTSISTSTPLSSVNYFGDDEFLVPAAVLQTAVVSTNSNVLTLKLTESDMPDNKFYFALHFMEVLPNTQRSFGIYFNGERVYNNSMPLYLRPQYIMNGAPWSTSSAYIWDLNSTGLSLLPPILNAFELYLPMILTQMATNYSDSVAITAIRAEYQVKKNWVGDPCAPQEFVWDGLNCSYGSDAPRITSVNLSSSSLSGVISSYFSNFSALEYLDLSNNDLTGHIPDTLGNLTSLKIINLKCNNFTGQIPDTLLKKANSGLLTISVDNSTNPCTRKSGQSGTKNKISTPIIVVIALVPALLIILLAAFIVSRIRRKPGHKASPLIPPPQAESYAVKRQSNKLDNEIQLESSRQQFTYADLVQMTSNFTKIIGQGGFGPVFHGYLKSGTQVAVKMLSKSSSQGTKEFLAEAESLTRIHHRNLVSLVGFCMEEDNLALVYDYMPQGSLTDHLRGKDNYKVLSWENRLRIAVDSAQGLDYLHKGCNPPLIHRDVKSNNILLGEDLEAKIADFGLSRAFQTDGQSYVSTQAVVGTPGYLDPEYHKSFRLSDKSDVYSFGIVLLEIVTGEPPIVQKGHIVQRIAPKVRRGDIDDIVDKNLRGEYDTNSLWKIVDLAIKCTAEYGSQRPTMSSVVIQLKESLELETANANESQYSQNFDTSQISAFEMQQNMAGFGPSAR